MVLVDFPSMLVCFDIGPLDPVLFLVVGFGLADDAVILLGLRHEAAL